MEKVQMGIENFIDTLILKVPTFILAAVILFVGIYLIRFTRKLVDRRFEKRNIDPSIRSFVSTLIKFTLYILLILTVANTLGIQTTSFIAALSAFGLAVGLALQGSLSNFAGGVLILLFRPFNVNDYISSDNGAEGSVEAIDILYTTLVDGDGIKVFSPNGTLANSVIKNYSRIVSRRFQFVVGIAYEDNIKDAKDTIAAVIKQEGRILSTPVPEIFVSDLADSAVNLTIRGWINKADYWDTHNSLQEKIKIALDEKGISIPYPQTEMHIKSDGTITTSSIKNS